MEFTATVTDHLVQPRRRVLSGRRGVCGILALALLGLTASALWVASAIQSDPAILYLAPEGGAQWIRYTLSSSVDRRWRGERRVYYRRAFHVEEVPGEAELTLRALRDARVYLGDRLVLERDGAFDVWKETRRVDLGPWLEPGDNTLTIEAFNRDGHVAVRARCAALGIVTDADWEFSVDRERWHPVERLDGTPQPIEWSRQQPPVGRAFLDVAPVTLPVFAAAFAAVFFARRAGHQGALPRPVLTPGLVRWAVIALWVLFALNSLYRAPMLFGFDKLGHLEYTQYIVVRGRVPLATEGWQLFQSPLFYLLSAIPYSLAMNALGADDLARLLRVLPLLCGTLHVEVVFRALSRVLPGAPISSCSVSCWVDSPH